MYNAISIAVTGVQTVGSNETTEKLSAQYENHHIIENCKQLAKTIPAVVSADVTAHDGLLWQLNHGLHKHLLGKLALYLPEAQSNN
jgi:hypothetical protein